VTRDLWTLGCLAVELLIVTIAAGLPLGAFLLRVLAPLPFAAAFAAAAALSGEPDRAVLLLARSAVSITTILLLASTTPMARLTDALLSLRAPAALVDVIGFVHRYLFVLAEQMWRMRNAAAARGGRTSVVAAAATIRTLFAQAYRRAENIHRAMLARGYSGGTLAPAVVRRIAVADLGLGVACCAGVALAFGLPRVA
jgi:cobalt/nickel transport system permease protein